MNTAFARAIVALGLVALPATAIASAKAGPKHTHSVAKKDVTLKKKGKHHGHHGRGSKGLASTVAKPSVAAKTAPAAPGELGAKAR